jgi:hypothetical protein
VVAVPAASRPVVRAVMVDAQPGASGMLAPAWVVAEQAAARPAQQQRRTTR